MEDTHAAPLIEINVARLEERLAGLAGQVKDGFTTLSSELRIRDEAQNKRIDELHSWRSAHMAGFAAIEARVGLLDAAFSAFREAGVVAKAVTTGKWELLKSQWTWMVGGAVGASSFIGLGIALRGAGLV